jgi:tetratricopeptide (TPR) repeat protein
MKTFKYGLFVLIVFMIVPLDILAQVKEIPVTTSSKEALNLFLTGRDKLENLESAAAVSLFDKAIQKDPDFAMAYLFRANSGSGYNVFRQDLDKAVSLTKKVSEGENLLILYNQASADGNGQKQKEYLDQLLKSFPADKRVHKTAGDYYYSLGDFPTALTYYMKSTELDKKFTIGYDAIGICQGMLNNYSEAEKAFQEEIKLVPNISNPHDSYAAILLKMGKYDESIAQYKKSLELDPSFSFSLTGLGDNCIFKGDYELARKYYQECFDKASVIDWKFNSLFSRATSYVHEGKIENAIKTFDEFRALAEKENLVPYAIWSYAYQAYVLIETGNSAEGMKYYEKATDLIEKSKLPEADKENLVTSSMLWRVYYLSANGELDKATAESEKCKSKVESRKNPGEEMSLNTILGYLEIKKGNYDKAIQDLSKGYKENPLIWYYTAVAYNKKGNKQDALNLFEKVTKWNFNSLELALFRKRAMDELKK